MDAFIELLSKDPCARSYAEIACLLLGRQLLTGELEEDYSLTKLAELGSSVVPVLEALEEARGIIRP